MRSAETHGAFNFEVSFSKLLMLHHLPEIIIYDGIYVVFCFLNSCLSSQGFFPLYSVFSLKNLHFKLPHLIILRKKILYEEPRGKILFKSEIEPNIDCPREQARNGTDHGQARVWQSDHGKAKLDRYVATEHTHGSVDELEPKLGRYVATEHTYGSVST
ncbi:hypothetical protein F2Q69_00059122 [Brassica cretica]|uniref:Uncharacterized protein n=1 Tax=Brassica cretica TaxID=69181 RepID=A0A8S9RBZ2_BRACR|nr:hypothetical protein F2Q69_00059122 [Brassica cretica]